MGAPTDPHTETYATRASNQQQQAPPPATMVSDSSSPGSAPRRGPACNHRGCYRGGNDPCIAGQTQQSGTSAAPSTLTWPWNWTDGNAQQPSTTTPAPMTGTATRGGHAGGGPRGSGLFGTAGQSGQVQSPQTSYFSTPTTNGGTAADTAKKDESTKQRQTLFATPAAGAAPAPATSKPFNSNSFAGFGTARDSTPTVDQRPALPTAGLNQSRPTIFKSWGEALNTTTNGQNPQVDQTSQGSAPAVSPPTSGPVMDTIKKNDVGQQPQPKISNPAPATKTMPSSLGGLAPAQNSSKAPAAQQTVSQAFSKPTSPIFTSGSDARTAPAKNGNNSSGMQAQPNGVPSLPTAAAKTSSLAPEAPGGSGSGPKSQTAPTTYSNVQSVQAAPRGTPTSTATKQSTGGSVANASGTGKKQNGNEKEAQRSSAASSAHPADAVSSSFQSGGSLGQTQSTMASGAPPATSTFSSSSPGLSGPRPWFGPSSSKDPSIGPTNGTATQGLGPFGSPKPLPNTALSGGKSEGSSFGRASYPPPAMKRSSSESQGPLRKRFKYDSTILVLVGANESEFTVHKDVIFHGSNYFNTRCSSSPEFGSTYIRLPDVEPEVFHGYLQWVYRGDIVTLAIEDGDPDLGAQEASWRSQGDGQALARAVEILSLAKLYIVASLLDDNRLKNATVDNFMDTAQGNFGEPGLTVAFINYLWRNTMPADNFRQAVLDKGLMLTAAPRLGTWLEKNNLDLHSEFITELAIRLAKAKPTVDFVKARKCAYHDHDEDTPLCT